MADDSVTGWAVRSMGRILPRTVCETRRGAMVNWLHLYGDVYMTDGVDDDTIVDLFAKRKACSRAELIQVLIQEEST
jgi:hypothetical protein